MLLLINLIFRLIRFFVLNYFLKFYKIFYEDNFFFVLLICIFNSIIIIKLIKFYDKM